MVFGLTMIDGLLQERKERQREAVDEIVSNWGNDQTISTPVLAIPYGVSNDPNDMRQLSAQSYLILPAEKVVVESEITPEARSRGIFQAVLYDSKVKITGEFKPSALEEFAIPGQTIFWQKSMLILGISDSRRMIGNPSATILDTTKGFETGVPDNTLVGHLHAAFDNISSEKKEVPFSIELRVRGSELFRVDPLATNVSISMHSPWKDPSFTGNTLPSGRKISSEGFTANWELSKYQTSLPRVWQLSDHTQFVNIASRAAVGVRLVTNTDSYFCTERALKHGILIIILVLGTFFLFELVVGINIHPLQYSLIGAALTLFYLALLSITELYSFNTGYGFASVLSILMISLYAKAILSSSLRAGIICLMLSLTYSFLFVVLTREDFSLLVGTGGLSAILIAIMYATRNLNSKSKLVDAEVVE